MLIHISDPSLIDNLVQFLERCDCKPQEAGQGALTVTPQPPTMDAELGRLQLNGYLRTWCSMHRGVRATLDGLTPLEPDGQAG